MDNNELAVSEENSIMLEKTLRSGQSLQAKGNVIVLGDVNPGAEIIASGHIVVLGSLKGVVHAGADGDETATVTAFELQPTQLRIGTHITRPPDGQKLRGPHYPETARIKDDAVIIEKYIPSK